MKRKTDHVICHDATGKGGKLPYTMECLHCGETYSPALPITVDMFVAMTKPFARRHRHCKPQKEAAAMEEQNEKPG